MYPIPFSVAIGSVALVAGTSSFAILAPLGAGTSYRVIGIHLGINRIATGVVDAVALDSGLTTTFARAPGGMQLTGVPGYYIPFPEPGYQVGDNLGVTIQFASTVAAGSGQALIYYYVDILT